MVLGHGSDTEPGVVSIAGAGGSENGGGIAGAAASGTGGTPSGGSAGEAGSTEGLVGITTIRIAPQGTLSVPAAAFSDETLGVTAIAGGSWEQSVVLAIDRGTHFEEHELDVARLQEVPALAASADGFFVTWWSALTDSFDSGTVHLAEVSQDGTLRSRWTVAEDVPGKHCDVALGPDVVGVAFGPSSVALCDGGGCENFELPACGDAGDAEIVHQEEMFFVARSCRAEDGVSTALRLSRIDAVDRRLIDDVEITTTRAGYVWPGMTLGAEGLFVVFAGTLYHFGLDGQSLSNPVVLGTLGTAPSAGASATILVASEVVSGGAGLFVFDAWSVSASPDTFAGEQTTALLDPNSLDVLQMPLQWEEGTWGTGVAVSTSGRMALARRAPTTVIVQELAPDASSPGAAKFVQGIPDIPTLSDVVCTETECRIGLTTRALSRDFGDIPAATQELAVDTTSEAPPDRVESSGGCGDDPCRVLFTADGGSVLAGAGEVRRVRADGSVAWASEPGPLQGATRWQGPFDRQAPYLMVDDSRETHVVQLSEQGMVDTPLGDVVHAGVACGNGFYRILVGASEIVFDRVAPPGSTSSAALPYEAAMGAPIGYVCDGQQLGVLLAPPEAPLLLRLAPSGEPLANVALPGRVVSHAADGEIQYFVSADEPNDPSTPGGVFLLSYVPLSGPASHTRFHLPERGWVERFQVSGQSLHVTWRTDRALWLTRFALDGQP